MRPFTAVVALAAALSSANAEAWNARGHMTVAAIAWARLSPAAQQRAAALLKLNPDYAAWTAGVPDAERDRAAFIHAATWPDDIKGRACLGSPPKPGCYVNDKPPAPPATLGTAGYADLNLHRYWHFRDTPFSPDGTALKDAVEPHAESQIGLIEQALADPAVPDEAKSYDLAWLIHLVGDAHQPLHAAARFTKATPKGDAGGNDVVACKPKPASCLITGKFKSNLHAVWDDAIGTSQVVKSVQTKADDLLKQAAAPKSFLGAVVARTDLAAPPPAWFAESFALAQKYAYRAPIGIRKGPYHLTKPYLDKAGSIAEQQILVAGLRLANALNTELGS